MMADSGYVSEDYTEAMIRRDREFPVAICIAAVGDEHIDVLTVISEIAGSEEDTDAPVNGADVDTLYKKLNGLA